MGDRDEILGNFQAISGIEDIAVCLDILEQKDWDMVAALEGVMPQQDRQFSNPNGSGPSSSTSNGPVRSLGFVDLTRSDGPTDVDALDRMRPEHPSGYQSLTTCTLGVYFGEKLLRLELPLDTTLGELKQQLELTTHVPSTEQVLSGWPEVTQVPKELEDQVTLGQLNVCGAIYHIRMDHQPPSQFLSLPHPQPLSNVALTEHDHFNKPGGPGSYPVLSYATVTNHRTAAAVPDIAQSDIRSMSVDPGSLDDERLSSQGSGVGVEGEGGGRRKGGREASGSGVGGGSGDVVIVTGVSSRSNSAQRSNDVEEIVMVHDSSNASVSCNSSSVPEEFSVEDEDLFDESDMKSCSVLKALKEPLVPEDCTEPYEVLQCFTHSFELRYGVMHPLFLLGSLADVVAEATSPAASSKTRKPMFVYLHHDGSVLSNVFCSQLLCSESVVNYLSLNFITWAWDLTLHPHRLKLLKMVEECFGASAKANVDEIRADHLPVILIAYKEKGTVSIKQIVQGETNLDALMSTLLLTVEEHNAVIDRETQEERERLVRVSMIAEQNRAYEESLLADMEKERKKEEQEKEEEMERQSKEAERAAMTRSVPEEPPEDCQEKMCTLRIRFPGGGAEQRRFLATHSLKDVINFVGSKNYMVSQYKILTSFPRKDLTEQDTGLTLDALKLCPQETVFVEERT